MKTFEEKGKPIMRRLSRIITAIVLILSIIFLSNCKAKEIDELSFDYFYGRIITNRGTDFTVSKSQNGFFSLHNNLYFGKSHLYQLKLNNRLPLRHRGTSNWIAEYYKPTVSFQYRPKVNLEISGSLCQQFNNMDYEDYENYSKLKNQKVSFSISFLSNDGKTYVPQRMLNFYYYNTPLLNRGQFEISNSYQYNLGKAEYDHTEYRMTNHAYEMSFRLGLPSQIQISITDSFSSEKGPNSICITRKRRYNNLSSQVDMQINKNMRIYLSPNWHYSYLSDKNFCGGVPHLLRKEDHVIVRSGFDLLTDNGKIDIRRILADYDDYYGHLLGRKQVKLNNQIYWKYTRQSGLLTSKTWTIGNSEIFNYGITDHLMINSEIKFDKRVLREGGSYYFHSLSLSGRLSLKYFSYGFDGGLPYYEIPDFDYYYHPLLKAGQWQIQIGYIPQDRVTSWVSHKKNIFDLRVKNFKKRNSWKVSVETKYGITDRIQINLDGSSQNDSGDKNRSFKAGLNFQILKQLRLTMGYNRLWKGGILGKPYSYKFLIGSQAMW